jgi:hypothetical protein
MEYRPNYTPAKILGAHYYNFSFVVQSNFLPGVRLLYSVGCMNRKILYYCDIFIIGFT